MTRCSCSANGYIYLVSSLVIIFGAVMPGSIDCLIILQKHGRWKVLGGSTISNVLCSVKNCVGLSQWKTVIKVFLASNLSEKQPDYTVELKKIYARDYTILHGTQPMSKVCM
jgi:hypothetical protein